MQRLYENATSLRENLPEGRLQFFLRNEAHEFLQDIPVRIQQVKFGLVAETERALEFHRGGIVGVEE